MATRMRQILSERIEHSIQSGIEGGDEERRDDV